MTFFSALLLTVLPVALGLMDLCDMSIRNQTDMFYPKECPNLRPATADQIDAIIACKKPLGVDVVPAINACADQQYGDTSLEQPINAVAAMCNANDMKKANDFWCCFVSQAIKNNPNMTAPMVLQVCQNCTNKIMSGSTMGGTPMGGM